MKKRALFSFKFVLGRVSHQFRGHATHGLLLPGLSKCPVIRIKEAQATYGLLLPGLSKCPAIRIKEAQATYGLPLPGLSKCPVIRIKRPKLHTDCFFQVSLNVP